MGGRKTKLKIINPRLYEKVKQYCIAARKLINETLSRGEYPPLYKDPKIAFGESMGSWTTDYIPMILWTVFIHDHKNELENLQEYKECLALMQADKEIAPHLGELVGTRIGAARNTALDYLNFVLLRQFEVSKERFESWTEPFHIERFKKPYSNLEKFFYTDKIEIRAFAPIENFKSDINKINLGNNLVIRRLTSDEKAAIIEATKRGFPFDFHRIISCDFAMELSFEERKLFGEKHFSKVDSPELWVTTFEQLITALRLFKEGSIGINYTSVSYANPIPILGGSASYDNRQFIGPTYELKEKDKLLFQKLWSEVNNTNLDQHLTLRIALRRFNFAYERINYKDKLIDYMIAFEALFFKQGEVGEFKHKLATRVARFLGETYEERQTISKQIKEFYVKRSQIVHGERIKLEHSFIRDAENRLRKAIILFFEKLPFLGHMEIISRLDLD